jgi:hypothetical protein
MEHTVLAAELVTVNAVDVVKDADGAPAAAAMHPPLRPQSATVTDVPAARKTLRTGYAADGPAALKTLRIGYVAESDLEDQQKIISLVQLSSPFSLR